MQRLLWLCRRAPVPRSPAAPLFGSCGCAAGLLCRRAPVPQLCRRAPVPPGSSREAPLPCCSRREGGGGSSSDSDSLAVLGGFGLMFTQNLGGTGALLGAQPGGMPFRRSGTGGGSGKAAGGKDLSEEAARVEELQPVGQLPRASFATRSATSASVSQGSGPHATSK